MLLSWMQKKETYSSVNETMGTYETDIYVSISDIDLNGL